MARAAYQFMFISLSAILFAVFFIVSPTQEADVAKFQNEIKEKFATAATQAWGKSSVVEPLVLVWNSMDVFYTESATQTLALIKPSESFIETVLAFDGNYQASKQIAAAPMVVRPPQEEPIYNIVPTSPSENLIDPFFNENLAYILDDEGKVAGESVGLEEVMEDEELGYEYVPAPMRTAMWVTLNDSITGVPYCVSIFNGELNSYPGTCARDSETLIYEN